MSVNLVPNEVLFTTQEEANLEALSYIGIISLVIVTIVAATFLFAGQLLARQNLSLTKEVESLKNQLSDSKDKEIFYRAVKQKSVRLQELAKSRFFVPIFLDDLWKNTDSFNLRVESLTFNDGKSTEISLSAPQLSFLQNFTDSILKTPGKFSLAKINNYSHKAGGNYSVSMLLNLP